MSNASAEPESGATGLWQGYSKEPQPLLAYSILLGSYWLLFGFAGLAARMTGRRLPKGFAASDIALLGVATHKVTRLVTKDWVTSPLRAPFTEYQGSAGAGEVIERSRGAGVPRRLSGGGSNGGE